MSYVVIVSVPDEETLAQLAGTAVEEGIVRTIFREPDLENSITAVAFEPGDVARRMCAQLPCALKVKAKGDLTMV